MESSLSWSEIARRIGTYRHTVRHWKEGLSRPNTEHMMALLELAEGLVLATLGLGTVVLAISALSFLGLGNQPPTPEWGTMLNDGRPYFRSHLHLMFTPGMAIFLLVLGTNLLGDTLRDAFDPRRP